MNKNKDVFITVRMSKKDRNKLEKTALKKRMNMSQYVRNLLLDVLEGKLKWVA